MKYSFKEQKFGPDFAKENIEKVKELIDNSMCFNVVSMPGVGTSVFLRFLATCKFAYFIFVDAYSLTKLTKIEYFKLLLKELGVDSKELSEEEVLLSIKERLKVLSLEHERIVIILNRFDQLKHEFDKNFFGNLQNLKSVDNKKIVIITTSTKPLSEINAEAISGPNIKLFSKIFYLKPYTKQDLELIFKADPDLNFENRNKIIELSGGHYQLFQLLIKSERLSNPLLDSYIKLQLKEIYDYLIFSQKKSLQKIAVGKTVENIDDVLIKIGLLNENHEIFSPLFKEYIISQTALKLPIKEMKLLKLLEKNINKVILKDEIFNEVWKGDFDLASDWALNSLIYRIRKNPIFINKGYIIESYKKQGYMLVKNK